MIALHFLIWLRIINESGGSLDKRVRVQNVANKVNFCLSLYALKFP
jgi:hypothetical protein